MATLTAARISELLQPFYPDAPDRLVCQLSDYLDLLLKWNVRTNLTSIRKPEEIVRRHFGESLFTARHLPACETLLDLGSGAGFPGIPIQLALPALQVTLAESQHKKAAFLREAVRVLGLSTVVWGDRVESLPADKLFDVVALRAVDNPPFALIQAGLRLRPGGLIAHLTSRPSPPEGSLSLPGSRCTVLEMTC